MKTMFKYNLLLLTCCAFASEEYSTPRIEEKSFGAYHGYYFSYGDTKGYVINKGEGKYTGLVNMKQMTPEGAEELYKSFNKQESTCPKKEES